MVSRRTKSRIAAAFSAAFILAAVCLVVGLQFFQHRAGDLDPAGPEGENASSDASFDSDGFPEVNWDYWLGVNPDILAWVSVPGTELSYPIVQADADDPQFYLRHDVYGAWNLAGCPYLDASCEEEGLFGSKNAVVFGHNMGGGDMRMFGVFGEFSNPDFARANKEVYIQTPDEKQVYEVDFVQVIDGSDQSKTTQFESDAVFDEWYENSLASASVVVDGEKRPDACVTFCTCSYNLSSNERTITTTSQKRIL